VARRDHSLDNWIESQISEGALNAAERWRERDRLLAEHLAKQAAARAQWNDSPETLRAVALMDQALTTWNGAPADVGPIVTTPR
jgi:hypothetical protein